MYGLFENEAWDVYRKGFRNSNVLMLSWDSHDIVLCIL